MLDILSLYKYYIKEFTQNTQSFFHTTINCSVQTVKAKLIWKQKKLYNRTTLGGIWIKGLAKITTLHGDWLRPLK